MQYALFVHGVNFYGLYGILVTATVVLGIFVTQILYAIKLGTGEVQIMNTKALNHDSF